MTKPRRSRLLVAWELAGGLVALGATFLVLWWLSGDAAMVAWLLLLFGIAPFLGGTVVADKLAARIASEMNRRELR
ncbi:MAG: hypothetical protein ACRDJC_18345 [Thermomicrobiales bacterium]